MKRTTNRASDTKQQPTSVQSFAGGILNKYKQKQGKSQFGGLSLSHKKNSLGEPSVVQQRVHVQVIAPKDTTKQPKPKKDAAASAAPRIERVIEREKVTVEKQTVIYRDVQRIIKEHRTVREIAVTQPAVTLQGRDQADLNKAEKAAGLTGSKSIAGSKSSKGSTSSTSSTSSAGGLSNTVHTKTESIQVTQIGKKAESPGITASERKLQAGTDFHKWIQARSKEPITIQSARRLESLQKPIVKERVKLKSSVLDYRSGREAAPLQLTNARSGRLRSSDGKVHAADVSRVARDVQTKQTEAKTSERVKQAEQSEAKTSERVKQAEQSEAKASKRAKQAEQSEAKTSERAKQAEQSEAKASKRAKQAEQSEAKTTKRVKQAEQSEAKTTKRVKQAEQSEAKTSERVKQTEQSEAKASKREKQAEQSEAKTSERAKQAEQAELDDAKSATNAVQGRLSGKGKPVPAAKLEHLAKKNSPEEAEQVSKAETQSTGAKPAAVNDAGRTNGAAASTSNVPQLRSERAVGQLKLMTSRGEMSVTINQLPGHLRLLRQHTTWFEAKPQSTATQIEPSKRVLPAITAKRLVHREKEAKGDANEQAGVTRGSVTDLQRSLPASKAAKPQAARSSGWPTASIKTGAAVQGGAERNVSLASARQQPQSVVHTNSLAHLINSRISRRHSADAPQLPPSSRAKGMVIKNGAPVQGNVRLVLRQSLGKQVISTSTTKPSEQPEELSQRLQNNVTSSIASVPVTTSEASQRSTPLQLSRGSKQTSHSSTVKLIHQSPKASPSLAATIHKRLAGAQPAQPDHSIAAQRRTSAGAKKKPQVQKANNVAATVAKQTSAGSGSFISSALKTPIVDLIGRRSAVMKSDEDVQGQSEQARSGQARSAALSSQPTSAGAMAALKTSTTHRLIRNIQQRTAPQISHSLSSVKSAAMTVQRAGSSFVPLSLQSVRKHAAEQQAFTQSGSQTQQAAERSATTPAAGSSPLRLRFAARQAASAGAVSGTATPGTYSSATAMPQLAHHQRKQAAQKEPERHVQVEAPKELDPEKLQKMIMKIPQLRPEAIADQVYKALERKMKLEQRRRGF